MRWLVPFLVLLTVAGVTPAQTKEEPLVQKVKHCIDRGVKFLQKSQREDGSWDVNLPSAGLNGGWTALVVLSLLNAGVPVDDPKVANGLRYLRKLEPTFTYVRALQTMVYAEANQAEDRERIQANAKWLADARVFKNNKFMGWTYTKSPSGTSDNSNTQYAVLGLWASRQAGIEVKQEIWESIREFYIRDQQESGGYIYSPSTGPAGHNRESLTMTTAGLCGLLVAGMELNAGREALLGDGTAKNCGIYDENKAAVKALGWISNRFQADLPQRIFYNLYGLERAGRLSGLRYFGRHDWYREGCDYLVKNQRADGSWEAGGAWDQYPVVSTSFALLFLSKGRTPVLISKLVHGPYPRDYFDLDWNNDRNDLRHLVDYARKEMFKNLPLTWQTFDVMGAAGDGNVNAKNELQITSEMLQSPILYITGHRSPLLRLRLLEKQLLEKYIDNGGFILAEACCGSPDFDRGFKALAAERWPDNELTYLDEKHAVWKSFFTVAPGKPSKLMGISMRGKYSAHLFAQRPIVPLGVEQAGGRRGARSLQAWGQHHRLRNEAAATPSALDRGQGCPRQAALSGGGFTSPARRR